jgi:imidazolonepropionase-like amidohydrolase
MQRTASTRTLWITALVAALVTPAQAAMTALVGGTLIDGTGSPPLNRSVVLIQDDRIVAIGREGEVHIPSDAARISTVGYTVLPGLIDVAVHLNEIGHGSRTRWREAYEPLTDKVVLPVASRALLAAGVTTARDVATPIENGRSVRRRIADGKVPGPTLLLAGTHIGRDAHAHSRVLIARTATELREAVAKLAAIGADAVILEDAAEYSAGELSTLHYAVEDAGMRWYAWVRTDADIAPAVRAGAFGLISLGGDFHETLPPEAASALTARAATGRPVYWALGASVLTNHEWMRANSAVLDEPRWKAALPPVVAQDIQQSLSDLDKRPIDLETPNLRHSVLGSRIRSARSAGARFLVGSLAGEPGHITSRATWQEAEALVTEAGYTPTEALRAATLDAAFALGKDADIGSIAPGKYADIVAVRGDVLRNIEHLADVRLVFRHGVRFTPSAAMDEEE